MRWKECFVFFRYMPSYIWSGKDSTGKEASERVTAASPEKARDLLLGRGWTDLRRQTSEIHDFVKQDMAAAADPRFRPKLTPQQELAHLKGTAPGFWRRWWDAERQSIAAYLSLAALLAWSVYHRKGPAMVVSGALLAGLVLLFPVLHFWFRKPSQLFQKLHQARNWRRWNEVLACLEALQKAKATRKFGLGETSMARYRALALAGMGQLDQAIDEFTRAAEAAKMPAWLRSTHLASIYIVAERYEEGLECYRQALEQATEKGIVCLDYGAYLVQRFNRPVEAQQLLAMAESTPLPDLADAAVPALRGMIAYRQSDFAGANVAMLKALALLEKRPKKKRYIFEPSILIAQGYLAAINAALGNKAAAQEYFAKSEKYLVTVRLDELIDEYHAFRTKWKLR